MTELGAPVATAARGALLRAAEPLSTSDSAMARFAREVQATAGVAFEDYLGLWRWSTTHLEEFWRAVVDWFGLELEDADAVLGSRRPPRPEWFPGARLSYPEHALRGDREDAVLTGVSHTRGRSEMSMPELRDAVARCRAGLLRLGVTRGDRVVGYLPNVPEAVIAFLATASLGAVWASCPPEFGARAVIDRVAQIRPKVLLAVDGYRYSGREIEMRSAVDAVRAGLPSVEHTVTLGYLRPEARHNGLSWDDLLRESGPLEFERVSFDHPLYVLFSSGTTGLPKAIVHGHGGILLEHAKALGLQNDVGPGDRFLWHATTGWMVWNYAVSALTVGASLVCFDGNPSHPDPGDLWRVVAEEGVSYFGTSAGHLMASRAAGLQPAAHYDLSRLRGLGSTGSPLPSAGFEWVYSVLGQQIHLSSVSGGTDICSAFVGGSPLSAVRAGEISAPTLGAAVAALDAAGTPVVGEYGELSVLEPMPSMPVALWGDETGERLRQTYFAKNGGVWSHGDWALFHPDMSCVIAGRSDATLNRGGVRMGTAEFYSVLDDVETLEDSVVVHIDDGGPGRLMLIAAVGETRPAYDVAQQLRGLIRAELSPRHVPDEVVTVRHLPRTVTGKRLEKPIKQILTGADPATVLSRDAITWPGSLDELGDLAHRLSDPRRPIPTTSIPGGLEQ